MPIVQRKSKLNDFLIGSYTSPRNKPHPNFAVQGAPTQAPHNKNNQ